MLQHSSIILPSINKMIYYSLQRQGTFTPYLTHIPSAVVCCCQCQYFHTVTSRVLQQQLQIHPWLASTLLKECDLRGWTELGEHPNINIKLEHRERGGQMGRNEGGARNKTSHRSERWRSAIFTPVSRWSKPIGDGKKKKKRFMHKGFNVFRLSK